MFQPGKLMKEKEIIDNVREVLSNTSSDQARKTFYFQAQAPYFYSTLSVHAHGWFSIKSQHALRYTYLRSRSTQLVTLSTSRACKLILSVVDQKSRKNNLVKLEWSGKFFRQWCLSFTKRLSEKKKKKKKGMVGTWAQGFRTTGKYSGFFC